MSKNQSTEPEITLRELLAVIVRGGRCVLVLAVVLALILGLSGLASVNASDPAQDVEYLLALDTYNMDRTQKEAMVARLKKDVENQNIYNQKSLLMQVDPYNEHVTTMTFAISGIEVSSVKESFAADETPVNYMTQRIQAQYSTLWKQEDLEKLAEGTAYAGVEEKYLREVITLSVEDGGVLLLNIIGSDVASCEKIANAVYTTLVDSESAVEKASYSHDFVLLHKANTKVVVDTELETKQLESQNKIETNQKEILKLEEELLKMEEPAVPSGMMSIVKKVILGGVAGAVLAMVWLVCKHLLSTTVTASQKLACEFNLTYLGNAAINKNIWDRMAQKTVREHVWKDSDRAMAYIRENAISHIPENKTVAVITSLAKADEEAIANVMHALGGRGHTIAFGDDPIHNADTLTLIRQCDGVVLAESAFTSKRAAVEEVLYLVERMNKPIYGYVMV